MYQHHHSARQQHGFYVIDVTSGSIVQYQSQPLVESTLGLDNLASGREARPDASAQAGMSDAALRYPIELVHSGR
jgi:hypothetical protein